MSMKGVSNVMWNYWHGENTMYTKTNTHKRQILFCQVDLSGEQFDINDLTTECDGTQHFKRYRYEVLRLDKKIPRPTPTLYSVPNIFDTKSETFPVQIFQIPVPCFNFWWIALGEIESLSKTTKLLLLDSPRSSWSLKFRAWTIQIVRFHKWLTASVLFNLPYKTTSRLGIALYPCSLNLTCRCTHENHGEIVACVLANPLN